ncbi:hypothetical protein HQ560_03110 [bacterium]|nr:hypothetical protein [bacterium]
MRCPKCKKRYIGVGAYLRSHVSLTGIPPCMHCGTQLVPRYAGPPPLISPIAFVALPILGLIIAVALLLGCPENDVFIVAMLCSLPALTVITFFFPLIYYQRELKSSRKAARKAAADAEAPRPSEAQRLGSKLFLFSGLTFFVVLTGLSLKRGDSLATLVDEWGFLFLIFAFYAVTSLSRGSAREGVRSLTYEICVQAVLLTMLIAYSRPIMWVIWVCGTIICVRIRVSKRKHREV